MFRNDFADRRYVFCRENTIIQPPSRSSIGIKNDTLLLTWASGGQQISWSWRTCWTVREAPLSHLDSWKVPYCKKKRTVSAKAIKLQYQTKTEESFRNWSEKWKGLREKSAMTSAKEKIAGRRRRGPRFGCSGVNQKSCRIQWKRAARLKQQEIFIPQ